MVKLWRLNGRDGPLMRGSVQIIFMLDHGSASPTYLQGLSRRWWWLKLLRLWLWFGGLRHLAVSVVELEVPGKRDRHVGAFGIHVVDNA